MAWPKVEPERGASVNDGVATHSLAGTETPTMRVTRPVLAMGAALLACLAVPLHAAAQFTPLTCTACTSGTQTVSYDWSTSTTVPSDPNCAGTTGDPCPHYIPNYRQSRQIVFNPHVQRFDFNFSFFETEMGYDYFRYGNYGGSLTSLSGNPTLATFRSITTSSSAGFQAVPAVFRFESDVIIGDEGIDVSAARVCCSNTGDTGYSGRWVFPRDIVDGYLLGSWDVVKFRVLNSSATTNLMLVLQNDGSSDFEIYARCNAQPTATAYSYKTIGTGGGDRVLPLANGACPASSTWYIAVRSESGAGQFTLRAHDYFPADVHYQSVGIGFNASSSQVTGMMNAISQAARELYGATEGAQQVRYLEFFNNAGANCTNCNGSNCNICFRTCTGTGSCCDATYGWIALCQDYYTSSGGQMHEMVHRFTNGSGPGFLADEYAGGGSTSLCGHSVLNANPFGDQNNLCFGFDHEADKTPGAGSTGRSSSHEWFYANGGTPTQYLSSHDTPDNYDYINFDFGGWWGYALVGHTY